MTTGFSIFLIAAGATLRYALSYRLSGIDLQILGSIIMATGGATLAVQAARTVRAGRLRARPVARTLPLPSRLPRWRPSEDGSAERFWPATHSMWDMPARAAGIRFEDNQPPPGRGPRPDIQQGWDEAAGLGIPYTTSHGGSPGDQPEGAPRPWPAQDQADPADGSPTLLPPRASWQLDEAGWPDEVRPTAPGSGR
ncbi:hypothetical protein [Parafrankia sp. FMc2]|uniref:hypothetical protein n=1 Tax=Parafrankia sp. FMc2 TaxID=3233196 RepID=UPI0034D5F420